MDSSSDIRRLPLVVDVQPVQDPSPASDLAAYVESLVIAALNAATGPEALTLLISPFEPVPASLLAAAASSAAAVEWLPLQLPSLPRGADTQAAQQAYDSLPLGQARYLCTGPLDGFWSQSTCTPPARPAWASELAVLVRDLRPFLQPERYLDPAPDFEAWYRQRLRLCARADYLLTPSERLAEDARYCLGIGPPCAPPQAETTPCWQDLAATLGLVVSRLGSARADGRDRLPRIAMTGPLPPAPSGISIYIQNQTRAAVNQLDVRWVDSQARPGAPSRPEPVPPPQPGGSELWWHHFANHRSFHTRQPGLLARHGGVVELHDIDLPFLIPSILVPPPGIEPPEDLRHELAAVFGGGPGTASRAEREGRAVLLRWVARNADALVVHSALAETMLSIAIPDGCPPIHVVPHGSWVSEEARAAALSRPVAVPSKPYVVVPGFVGPAKWPEGLVASVAAVPETLRPLLVFAGRCPSHLESKLREYARRLHVDLLVTGYLPDADFDTWLARASVALVGRLLVRGETSGAVLSAIRMGTPTVVASGGSVSELPSEVPLVHSVDLVPSEVGVCIAGLLADPIADPRAERRGEVFRSALPIIRSALSWRPTVELMARLARKRGS